MDWDRFVPPESGLRIGRRINDLDTSHSINPTGALKSDERPDFGAALVRLKHVKKIALIVGIAVLALAFNAAWQFASCELANRQLEERLRDLASRNAEHIGLSAPITDADLRLAVIREARELDIPLDPNQISVRRTVQRTVEGESSAVHLAADYTARVRLLGFSLIFRFSPSSDRTPT
jgi:hypothetical protein